MSIQTKLDIKNDTHSSSTSAIKTTTKSNRGKVGQIISEIPGRGFAHFKFQTPEEGRPGGAAKIKGILTPVQLQTTAVNQAASGSNRYMASLHISTNLK